MLILSGILSHEILNLEEIIIIVSHAPSTPEKSESQ